MPLGCAVGKPWSDGLTVVDVPRGRDPKRVTVVWPFYQAHLFLADQIHIWWERWPEDLWNFVEVIVVDDGSPVPARLRKTPCRTRLFRIEQDVPWNWLAARNIGAHHAETEWLILTDIDHVIPEDTLRGVVFGQHDPNVVYAFSRREHTGESVNPHSASFFMTKAKFWQIGGYDERLAGVYGTDGSYRKRMMAKSVVKVLAEELIRYEYVADSSVTTYERKTPAMRQARARKFASVTSGDPKTLSFPYHEVTA